MECLIGIGTGIVGKIGECIVQPVGHQIGYAINYKGNLETLESEVGDLDAERQKVERKLKEEQHNIREAEPHVKKWLKDVKQINGEAKDILKDKHQAKMKCLHGVCPNPLRRYQLSRKSAKMVPRVAELLKKEFTSYAYDTTPQEVRTDNYEALGSRTVMVKKIMDVLRNNPKVNMIGVYGIGGVGKTTLVKEVAKQAAEEITLFDDVVMVLDVKKDSSIERIQKEIAEKLGLDFPENESVAGKARRLFTRIKDQKTLVILDDVWERIDLETMGLVGVPTCKVLLTSRTRKVLSRDMHTQKEFPLEVLKEEESWTLFEKMAGDVIKDPSIRNVAMKVAKRCGGLPVLVVTVASVLKNSTLSAWNDALRRMKKLDNEELTEKTYLALEWTYDQLNEVELKSLFLLCGFLAGYSNSVSILDLLKNSIGLGLLKNLDTMGEAWDALNSLLEKLKDSCLLLDSNDNQRVRMHDLVHEVATRISLRDQHVLKVAVGDELKEWPDSREFREKCTMISLRSSSIPMFPEVLEYKELEVLHVCPQMYGRSSLKIPRKLFEETKKLKVLDLSRLSIPSLPSSLQFLKDLQTLCLDNCNLVDITLVGYLQNLKILSFQNSKFKELPIEIGQLTRLRLLDLTDCDKLEIISAGVLSSLTRLEELRMSNSFKQWEAEGVNITEKKNASLSELKHLSQLSTLQIHILDASILPPCLFSDALERYQIYVGRSWKWWDANESLNTLKLQLTAGHELEQARVNMLLNKTGELHLDGTEAGSNTVDQFGSEYFEQLKHLHVRNAEFRHIIHEKGVTRNLTMLVVTDIDGLFLLSSSVATSLVQLKHLEVSECPVMEEIISTNGSVEENMENMFSKLQILRLRDLPNLTSFCSRNHIECLPESCSEIEEIGSKENFENVVEHCLFDNKLGFPSLKNLSINGLNKLMRIWHKQNSPENFKSIEYLNIYSCERLKSVFPSSMVTSLNLLTYLNVRECGGLEVIVENEDGLQTAPKLVFSKVQRVTFHNLPQLGSFYPGMHFSCWPSLKYLGAGTCNKVELFAQELSIFQRKHESTNHFRVIKGSLFLMDKDSFPMLDYLDVTGMEIWDDSFPVKFLSKQENLQGFFRNLTRLEVTSIVNLRFLLSSSMARSLVQLTHLDVSECAIMEEIVSTSKSDEGNMENMFPKLKDLELRDLPNLTRFYSNEKYNEIKERDSKGNRENVVQHFLFDKKARLPKLKRLSINGLNKLRRICHNQLSPECLKNLETVEIHSCENLKNVFSFSMARNLRQLDDMEVVDCGVEEIISNEEGPETAPVFVFSKVTRVEFNRLPQLASFYPGKHISSWPSLTDLDVKECNKVEIFAQEFPSSGGLLESMNHTPIKGTLFLINKDSFPNLQELVMSDMKIWDGPFPVKFVSNSSKNLRSSAISFKNLTTLEVSSCPGLQYLIRYSTAESLMQLTNLEVSDCKGLIEIVRSNEGDDSGNEIAFTKLKHLKLSELPKLQGFCSGNCIVKFSSLETLEMSNRLKLIISPGDETLQITYEANSDTDIDGDGADSKTDEVMDTDADSKHEDETAQGTNKKEEEHEDKTVMGSRMEATTVDDYCAATLPTTSRDNSFPKIMGEDIPPSYNIQTQEDRGVFIEELAQPMTCSIHENENPPKDSLGGLENINAQGSDHQDSNHQILENVVGQGIQIIDTMEGNSKIIPILNLKEQVQTTGTNPRICREGEFLADVFTNALTTSKSGKHLKDRLSALAALKNNTKAILSAEDEVAKTVMLSVQADPSKLQHDVQLQENLKAALQHLEDKKFCNPKKLSSAMSSLNLIPQLSSNATALQSRIYALQKENETLQVERTNLNISVAESESSFSALILKEAALEEVYREIERLQSRASAMASEISVLEGHIESSLVDPTAFQENAHKIDANNSTIDEVEIDLVNIQATLDRHTSIVTRILKSLF